MASRISFDTALDTLQAMFGHVDRDVIAAVLESNRTFFLAAERGNAADAGVGGTGPGSRE